MTGTQQGATAQTAPLHEDRPLVIAGAPDPVGMTHAIRLVIEADRRAWASGHIPRKRFALASSSIGGSIF